MHPRDYRDLCWFQWLDLTNDIRSQNMLINTNNTHNEETAINYSFFLESLQPIRVGKCCLTSQHHSLWWWVVIISRAANPAVSFHHVLISSSFIGIFHFNCLNITSDDTGAWHVNFGSFSLYMIITITNIMIIICGTNKLTLNCFYITAGHSGFVKHFSTNTLYIYNQCYFFFR